MELGQGPDRLREVEPQRGERRPGEGNPGGVDAAERETLAAGNISKEEARAVNVCI